MYTEYQIRAALISVIETALKETGVEGFTVLARNPQNMTRDDCVVLIDRINAKRIGFQGRWHDWNEAVESRLNERMQWIEEMTWQISVCRQRQITDTINTQTADDGVEKLTAWLNSRRGAWHMRHRTDVPMAPVFTSQKRTRTYTDENDVYQQEESIDFRLQVVQTLTLGEHAVTAWDWETHPI